jgi:capsular exopolysaccharide synthesis family protein
MRKKKKTISTIPRKLVTNISPNSITLEQFRMVRANINFSMPDNKLQTIMFTSALPGEGKSTSAANVAIVFAQEGKKVLLVDADMRKPTLHYTFHTTNSPGLSGVLSKQWNLKDVIKETEVEGMHLITSGQIPSNPAELLGSKSMEALLEELKGKFDIIIFDAPPVLAVADAQILSNKCDGTILVISAGATRKESALKAKNVLQTSRANLIGTVLNNFKVGKDHYYYYGLAK